MIPLTVQVAVESWPIAGVFRIARGARTQARVVVVTLDDGMYRGRGECVPYARYGETVDGVMADILTLQQSLLAGLDRQGLQAVLPAGAARNALDCAFWDLEAKRSGQSAWQLAELTSPPVPLLTAYTLSLDTEQAMAAQAAAHAQRPLLKLKLTGAGDVGRVAAIRAAAPASALIVDANEAWSLADLNQFGPALAALGVALIEQPLPANQDDALLDYCGAIPLCADESCHDSASLAQCRGKYAVVNIKLDKTGGLTEALKVARMARADGFGLMVGCMVGTSLAMAPALLVAQQADWVDLDGPLLLAEDRQPGLCYLGSEITPASSSLWG